MNGSESNGWRERMDRAERAIQSLADTAAEHYARLAAQQEAHEARMAEHAARMAEIEAGRTAQMAEHARRMAEIEAGHTTRLNDP